MPACDKPASNLSFTTRGNVFRSYVTSVTRSPQVSASKHRSDSFRYRPPCHSRRAMISSGASLRAAFATAGGTWLSVTTRNISGGVQLPQMFFGHFLRARDERFDFLRVSFGVVHRRAHRGFRPFMPGGRFRYIPFVLAHQVTHQPDGR